MMYFALVIAKCFSSWTIRIQRLTTCCHLFVVFLERSFRVAVCTMASACLRSSSMLIQGIWQLVNLVPFWSRCALWNSKFLSSPPLALFPQMGHVCRGCSISSILTPRCRLYSRMMAFRGLAQEQSSSHVLRSQLFSVAFWSYTAVLPCWTWWCLRWIVGCGLDARHGGYSHCCVESQVRGLLNGRCWRLDPG